MLFRNSSHISCQCYHMTSFAVLMDVSRREVRCLKTPPTPTAVWLRSRWLCS